MSFEPKLTRTLRGLIIGGSRDPGDSAAFRRLLLVTFFTWVGLGAVRLSFSCCGPQEVVLTLGNHLYTSVFVGIGIVFTILIVTAGCSQIVELFPTGVVLFYLLSFEKEMK